MAFTVGIPGGAKDYEFEAYVRRLEREGVDLTDMPRVHDARAGSRWLHAWEERSDAEGFASRLREDTDNPKWQVYELPGVEPSQGPRGPVEVLVSGQSDGYTYGLSPVSAKLIRRKFPRARLTPSLFVSADTRDESDAGQEAIWDKVVSILSGLSGEQIDEVGGYRVYDPAAERVLREAPAFAH